MIVDIAPLPRRPADVELLRELTASFDDGRSETWRFLDNAQRQFARAQFEYLVD